MKSAWEEAPQSKSPWWHIFLANLETHIMTWRARDWHSESELDNIRISCDGLITICCYLWWNLKSSSLFSFCFGHSWARQGRASAQAPIDNCSHFKQTSSSSSSSSYHCPLTLKIVIIIDIINLIIITLTTVITNHFKCLRFFNKSNCKIDVINYQSSCVGTSIYGEDIYQRFTSRTNISVKNMLRPAMISNISDRTGSFHTDNSVKEYQTFQTTIEHDSVKTVELKGHNFYIC